MSLSFRLALILASLFIALAVIGAIGLHQLSGGLRLALAEGASEAGQRVVRVLTERIEREQSDSAAPEAAHGEERKLHVFMNGRELPPDQAAQIAASRVPLSQLDMAAFQAQPGSPNAADLHVEVRTLSVAGNDPGLWIGTGGFGQAIPLPRAGLDRELGDFTRRVAWGMGGLLLLGLMLAIWLAHRVANPLRELAQGAARLGAGERGVRVADGGVREVRETIDAFNRMAGELEQLDAEAQRLRGHQALAELGEIGRGLAHSLRNPLHALGLCVEALQAEARNPGTAGDLARAAREQISRLDGSLRGFLALSAGADAPVEAVRLRDVIDDVLLEARQVSGERIAFQAAGDLDATLNAVEIELRILLHSLVTNAAEASPPGSRVVVRVAAGDPLELRIEDQGSGIAPALRERLFQPHVSSKPQGAGMGLYLAQRLAVLRYQGELTLTDGDSGGCVARLRLHPRQGA